MTDPLDLDALERLCEAATEGPWEAWMEGEPGNGVAHIEQVPAKLTMTVGSDEPELGIYSWADANFIAAARTAMPRLILELKNARARIRELEASQPK